MEVWDEKKNGSFFSKRPTSSTKLNCYLVNILRVSVVREFYYERCDNNLNRHQDNNFFPNQTNEEKWLWLLFLP